ncbi:DNA repair and recombination protein RadB [Methanolapillus millepedarum]|uniref:DNA repair and recombination protein RadB n=1 Tax=Methanolapillus millepedarum TaxID=3028296 RepID=A0AA96V389_9EURY|nr:Protein RecA [Methanosarcinaceae archaeon Ac7]
MISFIPGGVNIGSFIPTGCPPIDNLLGGGIECGIVTQVYGEPGSGKTNLCLQAAVECSKSGKKVIYIDTEGLSLDRFSQIAGSRSKEIAQNILIYEPMSFDEQYTAIYEIEKILGENVGLIVVDSATSFYRYELDDDSSSIQSRRELSNQIGFLQGMARKSGVSVLITNQVFSDVGAHPEFSRNSGRNGYAGNAVRPLGGKAIEHISKTIIQLERTGAGTRAAKIVKHRCRPEGEKCEFKITSDGLR